MAGPDTVLEEDVFNNEPGHAAKHNAVNAQVNWLTDNLVDEATLNASIAEAAPAHWQPDTDYAERQAVLNPSGDIVFARSTHTSGATYDQTLWNHSNLIADLPDFVIAGHRGGTYQYPESTMAAYDMAVLGGAHIIEGDLWTTVDGRFAINHDATVDAMTNGTGRVDEMVSPAFKALTVDAGPPWPLTERPLLFDELVEKWGRKTVLLIQPNGGGATNIDQVLDFADEHKLRGSLIIECGTVGMIATAAARGYETYMVFFADPLVADVQAAIDAGATYIRVSNTSSDVNIASYVALGTDVFLGGTYRRFDRDRAIALGCRGIGTECPGYVAVDAPRAKIDPWRTGTLGQGTVSQTTAIPTIASGAIQSTISTQRITPGDCLPFPVKTSGTVVIDVEVRIVGASGGSNYVAIDTCMNTDKDYGNSGSDYANCYSCRFWTNSGNMQLYRNDAAAGITLGTDTSGTVAPVVGTWVPLRITINPRQADGGSGQIVWLRVDTGDSVTVTDNNYRGGYMRLVANAGGTALPEWRNLTLTY